MALWLTANMHKVAPQSFGQSSLDALACYFAAMIHDFNHPGTTNPHETKMQSLLAINFSDQSVLERHHLASAFAVLKTKGYDILSGLSNEDYRTVRALIVEFVLATDLTGHFNFIAQLKALAATRQMKMNTNTGQGFISHPRAGNLSVLSVRVVPP